MCGRFTLFAKTEELKAEFNLKDEVQFPLLIIINGPLLMEQSSLISFIQKIINLLRLQASMTIGQAVKRPLKL